MFDAGLASFSNDDKRDTLLHLARLAEAAERYDDMAAIMKKLVLLTDSMSTDLNSHERNLLSVAYKNVIGTRRCSWRSICERPDDEVFDEKYEAFVDQFKENVAVEIDDICAELLDLLENYLVKNADRNQADGMARVFYIKMLGDYYRYRAEAADPARNFAAEADKHYSAAYALAKDTLTPTDPIRLGLALNYSVCYYEILKKPKQACDIAREAFEGAIARLERDREVDESDYKDSTLIMQLLRDNLTLWADNEQNGDYGEVQEEDL
jgi:hypothetical protein